MLDTKTLTAEERQALTQLVKSPGWYLVMSRICIPQIQNATHLLDRPGTEEHRSDTMRGIKHAYLSLVETLYHAADLPNPFEQHALALQVDLRSYTTPPASHNTDADVHFWAGPSKDGYPDYGDSEKVAVCGKKAGDAAYTMTVVQGKTTCPECRATFIDPLLRHLKEESRRRVSAPV